MINMLIILVCVGSSCHLKGSHEIVDLMQNAIKENKLENDVTLAGSFCTGKCNRKGVTIQVNDDVYTGITPESFETFFKEHILDVINSERGN